MNEDLEIKAIKKVFSLRITQLIEQYSNEIKLLIRLKTKENIISFEAFEVDLINNIIFMVFEYAETDFSRFLSFHKKKINLHYIRVWWFQMLQAVHSIHQERIIHGDLKPANFVLVRGFLKFKDD